MGKAISKMMGAPSRKDQVLEQARAAAAKPARPADEGRDETGAQVKEGEGSELMSTATDVAMVTGKKPKRKGVPGLEL